MNNKIHQDIIQAKTFDVRRTDKKFRIMSENCSFITFLYVVGVLSCAKTQYTVLTFDRNCHVEVVIRLQSFSLPMQFVPNFWKPTAMQTGDCFGGIPVDATLHFLEIFAIKSSHCVTSSYRDQPEGLCDEQDISVFSVDCSTSTMQAKQAYQLQEKARKNVSQCVASVKIMILTP